MFLAVGKFIPIHAQNTRNRYLGIWTRAAYGRTLWKGVFEKTSGFKITSDAKNVTRGIENSKIQSLSPKMIIFHKNTEIAKFSSKTSLNCQLQ